jgi:predicted phosphodiesterase
MSTDTDWAALTREQSEKAHAAERASLQQQLDHAQAQIERMQKAKRGKIIPAKPARHRAEGDSVTVVVPDTHGAKIARGAVAAMLADIEALDPQRIILLGDHVDCGGFLAMHHVMGYVAETSYSYEDDIAEANAFLDSLRRAAPSAQIEYIEGNHERRVETWCVTQTLRHSKDAEGLRQHYAPEFRLNLKERGIPYYRQGVFYDSLPVPGVIKRGKCYFFHGISTSKHATAATINTIAGNCVFGHVHRSQADLVRRIGTGVIGSWSPGCLTELQPLWQHTAPTAWTHGYGVQLTDASGDFLHLNVPIIDDKSLFSALLRL